MKIYDKLDIEDLQNELKTKEEELNFLKQDIEIIKKKIMIAQSQVLTIKDITEKEKQLFITVAINSFTEINNSIIEIGNTEEYITLNDVINEIKITKQYNTPFGEYENKFYCFICSITFYKKNSHKFINDGETLINFINELKKLKV